MNNVSNFVWKLYVQKNIKKHEKTIVKCMKLNYNIHIDKIVYDYSIMEVWKWTKMYRTIM